MARTVHSGRSLSTPGWIRLISAGAVVAAVGLWLVSMVALSGVRDGLTVLGDRSGPEVAATSDLYFALDDMDAQVANALLANHATGPGISRADSLRRYSDSRREADGDLVQASAAAGDDPTARHALTTVVDDLGQYESDAATALALDPPTTGPTGDPGAVTEASAGLPPTAALTAYRQATDLMTGTLLPAASGLTDANAALLDRAYRDHRSGARWALVWVGLVGCATIALLVLLHGYLTIRFRRLANPPIVLAVLLAAVLVVGNLAVLAAEAEHLRGADRDAFASVLALSKARAVAYAANADESRYLLDPARADRYQRSFLAESQQLARLGGVTDLPAYAGALAAAIRAYDGNHADVRFTGYFGTEFRNLTFPGERADAERFLAAYLTYQRDDQHIRALAARGRRLDAIVFCDSYQAGDSNAHFSAFDRALSADIALNRAAFGTSVRAGEGDLTWSTGAPPVVVLVALAGLVLAGIWRRLAEYG